jgi:DNA-3-methyladenine glycosylase II
MSTFLLPVRGPFSLAASTRFLEGFAPAGFDGAAGRPLELAFPVEGVWQTAGVRVREHADGVEGEIVGPAGAGPELLGAVREQVARILSLDVDGSGFCAVGERDPVVAGLQRRYPGLRPVCFWSPYEAAAWAIIGARIRIGQAAAIKARMARELGESVSFGGRARPAFPAPQRLASLDGFPGLAGRKPEWLRSLAVAALDGRLDAARLRALPAEEALAQLKQLPGIGDFSAELVLLRGAGAPTRSPATSPGSLARSPSPTTGPGRRRPTRSRASAAAGSRTGPGSPCCCARTWKTRPARSPASGLAAGGLSRRVRGLGGKRRGQR